MPWVWLVASTGTVVMGVVMGVVLPTRAGTRHRVQREQPRKTLDRSINMNRLEHSRHGGRGAHGSRPCGATRGGHRGVKQLASGVVRWNSSGCWHACRDVQGVGTRAVIRCADVGDVRAPDPLACHLLGGSSLRQTPGHCTCRCQILLLARASAGAQRPGSRSAQRSQPRTRRTRGTREPGTTSWAGGADEELSKWN